MFKEISPGIYQTNLTVAKFSATKKKQVVPTPVTIKETEGAVPVKGKEIAPWGDNNDAPEKALNLIRKIGVAGKAVAVATAAHFGTGLAIYEEDDAGERKKIPFKLRPTIHAFNRRNKFNLYYSETIADLETHDLAFTEFILTKNFKEVAVIKRQPPAFCRFTVMNEKTGKIESVALNADWTEPDKNETAFVPCFSQYDYFEDIKAYCKQKKIHKFIVPFHYVRHDELYYNKPLWHAPLFNGWADVILAVPEMKKAIAENQLHFKYLVHISEEYFKRAFGMDANNGYNWDNFEPEKQEEEKQNLLKSIDEHLSGKKAAGRSMIAPTFTGPDGKPEKSITIEPVEDKIREGAFLPDAFGGNQEILFAKGIDPSIVGIGIPGGKNLSGSGSDKREAYTILCAQMVINRQVSLLPFYLLRDWNDWGEDLDAGFPNVALTTLDKNPEGETEILNG